MAGLSTSIESSLGLQETAGSVYISDLSQLLQHPQLATVSHAIRQAWKEMELDGVICIDNQPSAYFKEQKSITPAKKDRLVKFLWNHGTATQLVLIEETKIEVHSALSHPPKNKEVTWASSSLVTSIKDLASKLQTHDLYSLLKRIESGELYRENRDKFSAENSVDKSLLRNLRYLRNQLVESGSSNLEHLHALLGRLLFICFLEARGFIGAKHFPGKAETLSSFLELHLSTPEKGIALLYKKLFKDLQKEFNGSLFSNSMDEEQAQLTNKGFEQLVYFFKGDDVSNSQTVLPFWAYDFSIIPVETISAIYEDFLAAEDSKGKHEDGAYYTPRHLAELVVNMAVRGGSDVANWKFLDPSCGSGIFLVIAFNLLAEHWLFHGEQENHRRQKGTKINCLIDILCNQIRGVDKNPTACRIAAFSLYLALFEKIRPIDLDEFKKKINGKPILPNLLTTTANNTDQAPVITCSDFNELPESFPRNFQCVVGNPPWLRRGTKQIALPFVNQAGDYVSKNGPTCFVLPTSMLLLKHATLDKEWFHEHSVTDIVNLADYQRVLFTGPESPSLIIRYSNQKPVEKEHFLSYYTPRMSLYDSRQGLIALESNELKNISQREIAECRSSEDFRILWSSQFCATRRDLNLIDRLRRMPQLSALFEKGHSLGLQKGVGFKPFYPGETKDTPHELECDSWNLNDPYLASENLESIFLTSEAWQNGSLKNFLSKRVSRKGATASTTELRTKPKEAVFTPPMVLLNEGFTKAAYCSEKIRFQHAIHSISGPSESAPFLKLLVAFLSSELARYFTFYCTSGWMSGRKRVHMDDKMALPFPLPDSRHASKQASQALDSIETTFNKLQLDLKKSGLLQKEPLVEDAKTQLNELVYDYYGINSSERILIKDTLTLWVPSVRKRPSSTHIPTLEQPSPEEISAYAKAATGVLNSWAKATSSGYQICFERTIRPKNNSLRLVVLTIQKSGTKVRQIKLDSNEKLFIDSLKKMELALQKTDHPFQFLRGMTFFDDGRILLLKPDTRRHWSRTSGLNDADEILNTLRQQFLKQEGPKR